MDTLEAAIVSHPFFKDFEVLLIRVPKILHQIVVWIVSVEGVNQF